MTNNQDVHKKEEIKKLKDPKFYLENFCKVKTKEAGLQPFILKEAQKDIFNEMKKFRRIIILKARQLGFCLHPETKILTSNLEWKKLNDVEIGEKLVAVDEEIYGGQGSARKMQTTKVLNKWDVYKPGLKIFLDDGRCLTMTDEHKMLCKHRGAVHTVWREAKDMRIGDEIRYISHSWEDESVDYEDGWISGMIDGEGSLRNKKSGGTELTISQVDGYVWDRVIKYLNKKGYSYRVEKDTRKADNSSKLGNKSVNKVVINKIDQIFEILGRLKPSRFQDFYWWEGKQVPNNNGWAKIISIERTEKQRMIDLQTSEKTFIADGFISHNSTAIAGFFYVETIMKPGTTTALIGYNSDMVSELLDKVKTFYKSTPDRMKPTIQHDTKYQMSFPKMESKILVLPNTKDVGRGYTIHNCLSGDTEVFTNHGETKKIKDINVGEYIVNGNGGLSKIKTISVQEKDEELLELDVVGCGKLRLTKDHKILTREYKTGKEIWKRADEVVRGDGQTKTKREYIAYPYFQVRDRYKEVNIENVVKSGYETRSIENSKSIKLNYNFGCLIGWYLAEGTISKERRISFSLDKSEVDNFLELANKFKGEYISEIGVSYSNDSRTAIVNLYGKNFANLIQKYFGSKSDNKKINDSIWYWGEDFAKGLLFGLFRGNGYFNQKNKVVLTSTNESIIYQTKKLLVSLRIGLASVYRNKSYRYGKRGKNRYDLKLNGPGNYKFRRIFNLELPTNFKYSRWRTIEEKYKNRNIGTKSWKRGRRNYWMRIRDVKAVEKEKYVYDIGLEKEPHSFLTTCGVVHNCLVTELSSWDYADEKMAGLQESVPKNGRIIIESTPRGQGNLYHRLWMLDNEYIKKEYGWWWEYTKDEMEMTKKSRGEQWWAQEYGLEFLASGRSVFDQSTIREMRKYILEPGEINEPIKPEQVPTTVRQEDNWVVYRDPEPGKTYICGADVSEGVEEGDYSVAMIWDRETGEEVAMFRGLVPPDIFGEDLDKWGRKYNEALMIVESNNHGLTTLTALKNCMYPNMYFRKTSFETPSQAPSTKLGWKTTASNKVLIRDDLAKFMREGSLIPRSKKLLDEMSVFVYDDNGYMVPQSGFHDDCIFSAGIGMQGFKETYHGKLTQIDDRKYLPQNFPY